MQSKQKKSRFNVRKLEDRIAPTITDLKINGGGQTPNGEANGLPTISVNPAGKAPPGQN